MTVHAPKTCVVHFGMHKTGSSSIQQTLFGLERGPGWVYVHPGKPNASVSLLAAFGSQGRQKGYFRRLEQGPEQVARQGAKALARMEDGLREEAAVHVLSAEGLTQLSEPELAAFADWLGGWVQQVRCVGYARPVRGFIESAFQERMKTGTLRRFELDRVYPGYRARFEKFDRVFGRDRVSVRVFSPAYLEGGDVVTDLVAQAGLTLPDGAAVRANEGLSRDALSLLMHYHLRGDETLGDAEQVHALRRLAQLLRSLKGPRLRLSSRLLDPLIAAQAQDMAWIAERAAGSLDDVRGPDRGDEVASLEDLLRPGPAAVAWLAQRLAEAGGPTLPATADDAALGAAMVWLGRWTLAPQPREGRRRSRR